MKKIVYVLKYNVFYFLDKIKYKKPNKLQSWLYKEKDLLDLARNKKNFLPNYLKYSTRRFLSNGTPTSGIVCYSGTSSQDKKLDVFVEIFSCNHKIKIHLHDGEDIIEFKNRINILSEELDKFKTFLKEI